MIKVKEGHILGLQVNSQTTMLHKILFFWPSLCSCPELRASTSLNATPGDEKFCHQHPHLKTANFFQNSVTISSMKFTYIVMKTVTDVTILLIQLTGIKKSNTNMVPPVIAIVSL
jgi:hypothetical protein